MASVSQTILIYTAKNELICLQTCGNVELETKWTWSVNFGDELNVDRLFNGEDATKPMPSLDGNIYWFHTTGGQSFLTLPETNSQNVISIGGTDYLNLKSRDSNLFTLSLSSGLNFEKDENWNQETRIDVVIEKHQQTLISRTDLDCWYRRNLYNAYCYVKPPDLIPDVEGLRDGTSVTGERGLLKPLESLTQFNVIQVSDNIQCKSSVPVVNLFKSKEDSMMSVKVAEHGEIMLRIYFADSKIQTWQKKLDVPVKRAWIYCDGLFELEISDTVNDVPSAAKSGQINLYRNQEYNYINPFLCAGNVSEQWVKLLCVEDIHAKTNVTTSFLEKHYVKQNGELGAGDYGTVSIAKDRVTQRECAIKRIELVHGKSEIEEAQIMSQMKHPNLVEFYFSWKQKKILYIEMELCSCNLYTVLYPSIVEEEFPKKIGSKIDIRCLRGILDALQYVHSHGYVHGDVQLSNIFLASNTVNEVVLKLGDFGQATEIIKMDHSKDVERSTSQSPGRGQYSSPENISHKCCNEKRDVYRISICAFHLFCHQLEFTSKKVSQIITELKETGLLDKEIAEVSNKASIFFRNCLQVDHRRRPDLRTLINSFDENFPSPVKSLVCTEDMGITLTDLNINPREENH